MRSYSIELTGMKLFPAARGAIMSCVNFCETLGLMSRSVSEFKCRKQERKEVDVNNCRKLEGDRVE